MNLLIALLSRVASVFDSLGYSTQERFLFNLSYPSDIQGNRRAPGANAAFRRAATKARRIRRG